MLLSIMSKIVDAGLVALLVAAIAFCWDADAVEEVLLVKSVEKTGTITVNIYEDPDPQFTDTEEIDLYKVTLIKGSTEASFVWREDSKDITCPLLGGKATVYNVDDALRGDKLSIYVAPADKGDKYYHVYMVGELNNRKKVERYFQKHFLKDELTLFPLEGVLYVYASGKLKEALPIVDGRAKIVREGFTVTSNWVKDSRGMYKVTFTGITKGPHYKGPVTIFLPEHRF